MLYVHGGGHVGPVSYPIHTFPGQAFPRQVKVKDIEILTSNKERNSVANLRKTMIYNTNVDLVNDNVYTKFGLNRSICFQDIEQKLNSDVNQSRNSVAN